MSYLGSIKGIGRVLVGGQEVGAARYEISVSQSGHAKWARGSITAGGDVLHAAFTSGKETTLTLESGESVRIVVSGWSGDRADIAVNDPIPGF